MSNIDPSGANSGSVPANIAGNLNLGTLDEFGPSKGVWALVIVFLGIAVVLALISGLLQSRASMKLEAPAIRPKTEAFRMPTSTSAQKALATPAPSITAQSGKAEAVHDKENDANLTNKWRAIVASGKQAFLDGDYASAEERFGRAAELSRHFKKSEQLVTTLNNLAAVYQVQKKYQAAEALYKEAIDLLKKDGSPSQTAVDQILKNYGQLLRGLGRKNDADWLQHEREWINGRPVLL